jgi:signal transduction histidine kinase
MQGTNLQHYQQLFEAAPGLYLVLLPDLTITAVSDSYLQATMTKREEIIGRGLFEVFPDNPNDPSATGESNLGASLQQVLLNRTSHTMAVQQYDIRRPDGSFEQRYWSPLNKPVLDESGNLLFIIHRVEDVTDFIRASEKEAEQQKKISEMEIEIYKRAQEIQDNNKRLTEEIEERKKAEEAIRQLNKDLESFTYSVSHDLRAPLRVIDGYANLLKEEYEGKLDSEGERFLSVIKTNAIRMGRLIDDLLNLSRTGRQTLSVERTDMHQLVQEIIDEQQQHTKLHHKIQLNELAAVKCDSNLLRQVWINLLSNALKYSASRAEPVIEIFSTQQDNHILYTIKDNGVGFDMKYADKLFGAFQRLHKPSEFEGTGIGLALAARIIAKHGGSIWAEAEQGKGAAFSFSLPV